MDRVNKKMVFQTLPFMFSLCGLILSLVMWIYKIRNEVPPCTLSGCEQVITGQYSILFAIPIAAYGFFYYFFIATLFFQKLFGETTVLNILIKISLISGWIFTIFLRYLEFVKIGNWCQWCWLSVLFMIVITVTNWKFKEDR